MPSWSSRLTLTTPPSWDDDAAKQFLRRIPLRKSPQISATAATCKRLLATKSV